jgi:hypothetical protein
VDEEAKQFYLFSQIEQKKGLISSNYLIFGFLRRVIVCLGIADRILFRTKPFFANKVSVFFLVLNRRVIYTAAEKRKLIIDLGFLVTRFQERRKLKLSVGC